MKRFLIKLSLLLMVILMPSQASALYDFEVDGIYYSINGNHATVTNNGKYDQWQYPIPCYSGNVIIPKSVWYLGTEYLVTSIAKNAFFRCTELTSITFPNSITTILDDAFEGCSGLTNVTIPNSVTSIGDYAFSGCDGITSITIPNSITSIGKYAFSYCSRLTSATIPRNQKTIPTGLFAHCLNLTNITIPNSVTSIGDHAFSYCESLTNVTIIPNSVTSIGDYAFSGCKGLSNVTIPNSVITIGDGAFQNCSGLTGELTIPKSITSIGDFAFNGCCGLSILNFNATKCNDFFKHYNNRPPFYDLNISTINVGDNVTRIPAHFVDKLDVLKTVYIGKSVTTIGEYAFSGSADTLYFNAINCNAFTVNDDNLEGYPFHNLNVSTIKIGDNVQTIPNNFANRMTCLKTIYIGNSVKTIGDGAFYGCTGITDLTLPNSVTSIRAFAFSYCKNLINVTIPNSVTEISSYSFYYCSGLRDVTIGNSVQRIGISAFSECRNLEKVIIPSSVRFIDNEAFCFCDRYKFHVYSYPDPSLVELGSRVFYTQDEHHATLHVLPEYLDAYKRADQWKDFYRIVADLSGLEEVSFNDNNKTVDGYYDLNGIFHSEPINGVNIVKYNDGTFKKMMINN